MKNKKFIPIIALLFCITFLFTGCNNYVNENALQNFGIKVTTSMGEFIKEKTIQENYEKVDFNKFIAYDYDTPIKLYKLNIPTFEDFIQSPQMEDFLKNYNNCSDLMKEQYKIQLNELSRTFLPLNTYIEDFETLIFVETCFYIKNFNGYINQNTCYLYIFETGIPMIVIFEQTNKNIKATGIYAPVEKLKTLSGVREVFEQFNFTIETLNII